MPKTLLNNWCWYTTSREEIFESSPLLVHWFPRNFRSGSHGQLASFPDNYGRFPKLVQMLLSWQTRTHSERLCGVYFTIDRECEVALHEPVCTIAFLRLCLVTPMQPNFTFMIEHIALHRSFGMCACNSQIKFQCFYRSSLMYLVEHDTFRMPQTCTCTHRHSHTS